MHKHFTLLEPMALAHSFKGRGTMMMMPRFEASPWLWPPVSSPPLPFKSSVPLSLPQAPFLLSQRIQSEKEAVAEEVGPLGDGNIRTLTLVLLAFARLWGFRAQSQPLPMTPS